MNRRMTLYLNDVEVTRGSRVAIEATEEHMRDGAQRNPITGRESSPRRIDTATAYAADVSRLAASNRRAPARGAGSIHAARSKS
jgi:hypothetical protein